MCCWVFLFWLLYDPLLATITSSSSCHDLRTSKDAYTGEQGVNNVFSFRMITQVLRRVNSYNSFQNYNGWFSVGALRSSEWVGVMEKERARELLVTYVKNLWWSCTGSMHSKWASEWAGSISAFETHIWLCKSLPRLTRMHLLSSTFVGTKDFTIKNQKMVLSCSYRTWRCENTGKRQGEKKKGGRGVCLCSIETRLNRVIL